MTDTDRIKDALDFIEMIIPSLEKNEPVDYKGAIGLLKSIKRRLTKTEETGGKK